MGLGEVDDQLEQTTGAPPATRDVYTEAVTDMLGARGTLVRSNLKVGAETPPDTTAEAKRLADALGLPMDVVSRNLDTARQQAQAKAAPVDEILAQSPHLAEWLGQSPAHASVVQDDLHQLGLLEWLTTGPQRAFKSARSQQAYAELRIREMYGQTLTADEQKQKAALQASAAQDANFDVGNSWFRGALTGFGSFAGNQVAPLQAAAAGALTLGTAGAVAGSVLPGAGTVAGGLSGFGMGAVAGGLFGVTHSTFQQETVGAYDEFVNFKDEMGRPIDPQVARAAALVVGGLNAFIEAGVSSYVVSKIPGIDRLSPTAIRATVKTALRSPTIRASLSHAMLDYGKTLTAEVAQEASQDLIKILFGEAAKTASNVTGLRGETPPAEPGVPHGTEQPSNEGLQAIRQREGFSATPYQDAGGPAIGYGMHTWHGQPVTMETPPITTQQADAELATQAQATYGPVITHALAGTPVTQGQYDALLSVAWNSPAAGKRLAERLHAGETLTAADFAASGTVQGKPVAALQARRAAEFAQFGEAGAATPATPPAGTPDTFAHRSLVDIVSEVGQTITGAAQSFALGVAFGPALEAGLGVRQARQAKAASALFQQIGEGVKDSKTFKRAPAAVEAIVQRAADNGPAPNVYIPTEAWAQYWQDQGLDPAEVAKEVTGRPDALDEAQRTGTDLRIPTGRYATTIAPTEHNAYFANELRLTPEEMNAREADAALEAQQAQQEAQTQPPAAEPTAQQAADEQVHQAIVDELQRAGFLPQQAEAQGQLIREGVGRMAADAGIGYAEALQPYGLQVNRPTAQEAAGGARATIGVAAPPAPSSPAVRQPGLTGTAPEAQTAPSVGRPAEGSGSVSAGGVSAATRVAESRPTAAENEPLRRRAGESDRALASRRRDAVRTAEQARTESHYDTLFAYVAAHAQQIDPGVDLADLRQQFDTRVSQYHEMLGLYRESGHDPTDLLRSIASAGGLNTKDTVFPGEVRQLQEGAKFGKVRGHLVFTKDGQSLDDMLTSLRQDQRFQWLETPSDLVEAIDHAMRHEPARVENVLPGSDSLAQDLGINVASQWWAPPVAPQEATTDAVDEGGDTSFNPSEFGQSLFDPLKEAAQTNTAAASPTAIRVGTRLVMSETTGGPKEMEVIAIRKSGVDMIQGFLADRARAEGTSTRDMGVMHGYTSYSAERIRALFAKGLATIQAPPQADLLDTGEVQPRLPGAEAARDAENATPQLDAPFALTSEVSKAKKGTQTTLFQPAYHGSPHIFEQFSLHAIGSGEGAQAYGWGLYFASKKEVADAYREQLAGERRNVPNLLIDGTPAYEGPYREQLTSDQQEGLHEVQSRLYYEWKKPNPIGLIQEVLQISIENAERDRAEFASRGKPLPMLREGQLETYRKAAAFIDEMGSRLTWEPPDRPGRTYTVDVPENEDLLAWDVPASQQSPKVQAALKALGVEWQTFTPKTLPQFKRWMTTRAFETLWREDIGIRESLETASYYANNGLTTELDHWQRQHQGFFAKGMTDPTGESIYERLKFDTHERNKAAFEKQYGFQSKFLGSVTAEAQARSASEALASQGVAGIRYLDGFSRDKGEGSYNYVIFDDKLVNILEYDQPFFHGSPHDFQKFTTDKIGTGEGAASYGWGLYFAENPKVAADYYDRLAGGPEITHMRLGTLAFGQTDGMNYSRRAHVSDKENIRASLAEAALIEQLAYLGQGTTGLQKWAVLYLDQRINDYKTEWPEGVAPARELRAELAKPGAVSLSIEKAPGAVYQVSIDDAHVANMLDLDAPLKDQTDTVKQIAREFLVKEQYLKPAETGPRQLLTAWKTYVMERGGFTAGDTGQTLYDALEKNIRERNWSVEKEARYRELVDLRSRAGDQYGPAGFAAARPQEAAELKALEAEKDQSAGTAARDTSLFLLSRGVPGNKYLDQGSRDTKKGTKNVVVFDDKIVELTHKNGTPVSQDERDQYFQTRSGRRGSIQIGPDRQMTINLFERADLSTFLHESGHFFLEVFSDLADRVTAIPEADRTAGQNRLAANYQALLNELGVENRNQIGRDQHEQFASMFERYLFEAKAPSEAVRSIFAQFRKWLLGVYQALGPAAKLTPEVRQIFDRMLASDQQIAAAEARGKMVPLFTTAESMGMSDEYFALYRTTLERAHETAVADLDAKLAKDIARTHHAEWKARRAEIHTAVEQDYFARPVYQALAAIRRGLKPDGSPLVEGMTPEPMQLSKAAILAGYGPDALAKLPAFTYVNDGGLAPEQVATLFGYETGDALLTALAEAPPMRAAIEQDTDKRMIAEHGSLLFSAELPAEAQASAANEMQESVIRQELRALAHLKRVVKPFEAAATAVQGQRTAEANIRTGAAVDELRAQREAQRSGPATIRAAVPSAQTVRVVAQERIAATRIRDLEPRTHWAAMTRAATQATEAAARGDYDAAIHQSTLRLLNLGLYRETEKAKSDVETRIGVLRGYLNPGIQAKVGKAGGGFLEQLNALLARYDLAHLSNKAIDARTKMKDWLPAMEREGMAVDALPASVTDDERQINYRELPYESFVGLSDGAQMLVHLAQQRNKFNTEQLKGEFIERRDTIVDGILAHNPVKKLPLAFGAAETRGLAVSRWFASHTRLSELIREVDGIKEGGRFEPTGPLHDAIVRPLSDAQDLEHERKLTAFDAIGKILDVAYPGRELARLKREAMIEGVGTLSLENRLAIALNAGNRQGLDRLIADQSRHLSQPQIQQVLETLDATDKAVVEALWKHIDSFWPDILTHERRLTGIVPEKVEAVPFQTHLGEWTGGYYPLMYDGRLAPKAKMNEAATEAHLATAAAYVRTTTRQGHIETRREHLDLPTRLDLGVAYQHVEQVIHDLTHRAPLLDATRLIRDRKLSRAIYDTKGSAFYDEITGALQDIAIGHKADQRDKIASFIRTGSQVYALGFNLWTGVQQPLGIFNGMSEVGPTWVAKGLTKWLRDAASMDNTVRAVTEKSNFMRHRFETGTQDLADLHQNLGKVGGWFDTAVRTVTADKLTQTQLLHGFLWHIGMMQRVADMPTWLGAYEKGREALSLSDEDAVAYADQKVIDSQGGGRLIDLSSQQRGGPVAKLFLTFYSYGATIFNSSRNRIAATDFMQPSEVLTLLGHASLLYVMPAFMTIAMAKAFGKRNPEDPEDWLRDTAAEALSTALNSMIYVREIAGAVEMALGLPAQSRGYEGPAGTRLLTEIYNLAGQIRQHKIDEGLLNAANQVTGILFKYPGLQAQRTIEGFMALEEGKTHNPAALLFGYQKNVPK